MTRKEHIREALATLPEDTQKQIRDAFFAYAAGANNLAALLQQANLPELSKELALALRARKLISQSQLSTVL